MTSSVGSAHVDSHPATTVRDCNGLRQEAKAFTPPSRPYLSSPVPISLAGDQPDPARPKHGHREPSTQQIVFAGLRDRLGLPT